MAKRDVAKSRTGSEERLDALYREHPDGFVAGRDELATELRAAGEGDEAARVKKLRRPTTAAWLVNRAALEEPAQLEEFAEASRELEKAQARALEGKDEGGAEWRAAATREREATGAVAEVARRTARDAGHAASERSLELVVETLRAAAADAALRDRVVRGRLDRERSAATLGGPSVALPSGSSRPAARPAKRRDVAQARRELKRLEGQLADAEARGERLRARIAESEEALRDDRARLTEAKREAADLKRQVKSARRRAKR